MRCREFRVLASSLPQAVDWQNDAFSGREGPLGIQVGSGQPTPESTMRIGRIPVCLTARAGDGDVRVTSLSAGEACTRDSLGSEPATSRAESPGPGSGGSWRGERREEAASPGQETG